MVTKTTTLLNEYKNTHLECIKFLRLQSADVGKVHTSETVTFIDNSEGIVDDCGYVANPIASAGATSNTSLAQFLSRPTLVDTRTWSTADLVGYAGSTIEPWHLFLNNAVIKQKLANYAFIRAKLCMKVVINATPFHFGLMRVAYEPNVNAANTGERYSSIRNNGVTNLTNIVPLSQLPGIWLHPSDNSGGELHVPFFKTTNWLKMNVKEPAKSMGVLYYYITGMLKLASTSGTTSITIDTFAWLEDVELCGSTAELTLQAKDEYDGVVSQPATAIAKVASKLKNVPVIGKFARATEIGASTIADIAHMFGFTNTPVISDLPGRIPLPGPILASTEIGSQVQKLALDPKQELSVDNSLHGIPADDEMSIESIVTRTSALTTDSWSTADAVGTVIFNANVSPMLFSRAILASGGTDYGVRVYHTPMSYLGMMFSHWRGDVIVDIEVICTKFHKGRLKITWDPLGSGGLVALPENTVYTTVLDIGENNKASFQVPYHQATAWLRTRGVYRDNWNVGNALPSDDMYDNGLFSVSVLTPLMSPVSPQSVDLLISVRGGSNFEFANPSAQLGETYSTPPPSFFPLQGKDEVDILATNAELGDTGSQHPQRYALNFGECVASLRSVLHRMSVYDVSTPFASGATRFALYSKSYTRLPPSYGFDPSGLSSANKALAVGTAPFNYTPTHPITYVSRMYGGFRGGVNYTANFSSDLTPYIGECRVARMTEDTFPLNRRGRVITSQNTGVASGSTIRYLNTLTSTGTGGAAYANGLVNSSISWNTPHMSNFNFSYSDPAYSIPGNVYDQTTYECSSMDLLLKQTAAVNVCELTTVTTYAGTGVDFSCLWWLCCPTVDYYYTNPTTT